MANDKTVSTENIDSYKRVREPLSPRNSLSKVIKTSKILGISRFFVFTTFQNIHSFSKIKRPHRDPN